MVFDVNVKSVPAALPELMLTVCPCRWEPGGLAPTPTPTPTPATLRCW